MPDTRAPFCRFWHFIVITGGARHLKKWPIRSEKGSGYIRRILGGSMFEDGRREGRREILKDRQIHSSHSLLVFKLENTYPPV